MATVTKPMALDETLQGTNNTISTQNSKLDTMNTKLQAIVDAIGSSSLIGDTDISGIADGTITGAIAGLDSGKVDKTSLGANNGVAQLDSTGKVPSSQLPSFVDDVLEYASVSAFPATGESGKIYVALDTNLTYRWGGSAYVEISPSLALGETSSTAYRGDRGKIAYDHSQDANRVTTATAVGLYKVGATSEGHISGLTAIQKSDLTGVGLVGSVTDSTTNGNIVVDGVEIQAYDDTDVQNDIDAIEDELSTDYATVEGNPINFSTKSAQNAKSTILSLEPIQDLHGYDKPWVGGAGKNKLPLIINNIKSANTAGTWSGNVYTSGSSTFTILADLDGNVIGIKVDGSANVDFAIPIGFDANGMIVSGCPANGSDTTYYMVTGTESSRSATDYGNGSIMNGTSTRVVLRLRSTYTANNLIFYPMIRLSTESDATFQPYTNECGISGRSEIGILGCGKNLLDYSTMGDYDVTGTGTIRIGFEPVWLEAGTYTASFNSKSPNNIGVYITNITDNYSYTQISDNTKYATFTLTQKSLIMIRTSQPAGYASSTSIEGLQLEKNNQPTQYTAYQSSNDLTISLGQTVYGASVDVENGVLVVDTRYKEFALTGTETWYKRQNRNIFYTAWTDTSATASSSTGADGCFNSNYKCVTKRVDLLDNGECVNLSTDISSNVLSLSVRDDRFTTAEAFKDSLSTPMQIVYPLTTPITINLTPHTINLLKGVNNISTDGDKITLTYRDGKVATLGDLTSAVDNLDSKIDESKILTDTATGDKYILVVTNGVLSVEQISN